MIAALLASVALAQNPVSAQAPPRIPGPTATPEAITADTGALRHRSGRTPPVANAVRLSGHAPRIDGRLDEAAWQAATPVTQFTQVAPHEGQPASERTEVRVLYDNGALYVGARLYDSEPRLVRSRLSRRDNLDATDIFGVGFDSYHDHRTAFVFYVNPAGVKSDEITTNDNSWGDRQWDPVWDVATSRDSLGWVAEFRIPFSQLRFSPRDEHVWGVNFMRWIERKNERSLWGWWAQTDRGFASYFGHVFGLHGLPQPRRLEALPYFTARERRIPPARSGDPFNDGSTQLFSAGLDLKYGLTSNITLDATFNPDFGQVEADPAFVNLTAFEQFFEERRPFFVEGSSIFNFGGNHQFFYSRRVGRPPQGFANSRGGGFVNAPENSTILGAAKVSGRFANGWSVGLLEAVTAREYATVDSSGTRFTDEVEPLSNYFIARGRRDFAGGTRTIGFIATAVNRDLREPRLAFLRSSAYAWGADYTRRFDRNRFALSGSFGASLISGDTLAIQQAQLSSARYYRRPDASHVTYDPTRTSLGGWTGALSFAKQGGNWTYNISSGATSPGFELNDAGFQTRADQADFRISGSRRWTRPGRVFRSANVSAASGGGMNFGGVRTNTFVSAQASGQFLNYWRLEGNFNARPSLLDDRITRGGPLGRAPASGNWFIGGNTDWRKPFAFFAGVAHSWNTIGGHFTGFFSHFEMRPSAAISVSVGPNISRQGSTQQYVRATTDTTATATFGRRYVFADIEQRSLDLTARVNVTFSPDLSLQFYVQPFVATGSYSRFKELRRPRTHDYLVYGEEAGSSLTPSCVDRQSQPVACGLPDSRIVSYRGDPDGAGPRPSVTIGNPDFSVRSLRGNAVLRWEYMPGSTLFFVWTTSCSAFSPQPSFRPVDDLGHLCRGPSQNVFAVKMNYWLSF